MGYYKFCNREHAPNFIDYPLKVRFTRLRYYQMLEIVTGDDLIGDSFEGSAKTRVNLRSDRPNPAAEEAVMRSGVIKLDRPFSAFKNSVISPTIVSWCDCFVFCFADGDFETLAEVFGRKDAQSYDAAFEIPDFMLLAQRVCDGTIEGVPVAERFNVKVGEVTYEGDGTFDIEQILKVETGNPFRKRAKYAGQEERRIVLIPKARRIDNDDHLTVELAPGFSPFEEREFDGSTRDHCSNYYNQNIADNAIKELKALCDIWQTTQIAINEKYINKYDDKSYNTKRNEIEQYYKGISHKAVKLYWLSRALRSDEILDMKILMERHLDTSFLDMIMFKFVRQDWDAF